LTVDGGLDLLEGEGLRRSSLEIIRLRALPISPGSDLRGADLFRAGVEGAE
jgi:hypothetical protein